MSEQPALRVLGAITGADWAMTQDYLDLMVSIALRENDPVEAVERRLGRRLEHTRTVTTRGGVATIPVSGPIFRYANLFTYVSGGTTVEQLAQDLTAALDDPGITSILLSVDSPGGEISGINELAEMIAAARQQKPVTAYVGALGASAAYWLASAAERIVVDATAMLGSIGVIAAVRDPTKVASRDIEFVSSQSPNKRNDPTTDAGRAAIQARIDALAEVFIAAVARNRGVSPAHVVERFGAGGLLVGQAAVEAGLADALGSYEGLLAELSAPPPSLFAMPSISAAASGTKEIAMPPEETQAQADELARLRQQLAAERSARIKSEASAFVETHIRDHRMLPAERASVVTLYEQLAADDAAQPRTGESRTDLLRAAYTARPQHDLTKELVSGEQQPATVVANRTTTPASKDEHTKLIEEAEAHARAYAARANGKK